METTTLIEIKRGLHRICDNKLVNAISELTECEDFYRKVFLTYGLMYTTETVRQKRTFVAAITKYLILDRLPKDSLRLNDDGKFEAKKVKGIKNLLEDTIETFYTVRNSSESNEDFKKKYAEHFNETVKDFSKEISENRDESLSDFAKAVQKVYNYKDEKGDC